MNAFLEALMPEQTRFRPVRGAKDVEAWGPAG